MRWIDELRAAVAEEEMRSAIALIINAEKRVCLIGNSSIRDEVVEKIGMLIDKLESDFL